MQSFLDRWRIPYLLVIAALTAFFAFQCLQLRVDQDNRSMDADNESQALVEKEFARFFQSGDSIIFAIHKKHILDSEGKNLIENIGFELQSIEGIEQVISLADHNYSTAPLFDGLLISKNRDTAGIHILLDDFHDEGESIARIIQEIQTLASLHESDQVQCYITGLPLQKYEAGRLVLKDQKLFAPLSFLILGGVLLLITRHFSGLVFPLLISAASIIWTLGIYSLLGFSLNMITSLLPPVIMTLSITTSIHIYLEWLQRNETDKKQRIAAAIKTIYRPCLFATLTTAIGFLSLLSSDTPAVRQFGLFTSIGVIISYLLGVTGLAVGLSFLAPPIHPQRKVKGLLTSLLEKISEFTIKQPIKIVITSFGIALISLYGSQKIHCNTDLLRFLGPDNPLYIDSTFIDQNLTGVNCLELLISKKDKQAFSQVDELQQLANFQQALTLLPQIKHSLSVVDLLTYQGDPLSGFPSQPPFASILKDAQLAPFISPDLLITRISLRISAIGSSASSQLINNIHALAEKHLGGTFTIKEAGGFYRVISESDHLVASQIKSFAIALTLILLTIGIVFRSIRFMGLAIIPNIIPLLMSAAIMGFFSIDLSTGTAMIASVVIGIAVDDTIHYLSAFKKTFGGNCDVAIRNTTRFTGYALTSTTLALSLGFWVALFGSFQPTVYFALLSGLTMWFALICDLLVLPACLKLTFCSQKKT